MVNGFLKNGPWAFIKKIKWWFPILDNQICLPYFGSDITSMALLSNKKYPSFFDIFLLSAFSWQATMKTTRLPSGKCHPPPQWCIPLSVLLQYVTDGILYIAFIYCILQKVDNIRVELLPEGRRSEGESVGRSSPCTMGARGCGSWSCWKDEKVVVRHNLIAHWFSWTLYCTYSNLKHASTSSVNKRGHTYNCNLVSFCKFITRCHSTPEGLIQKSIGNTLFLLAGRHVSRGHE